MLGILALFIVLFAFNNSCSADELLPGYPAGTPASFTSQHEKIMFWKNVWGEFYKIHSLTKRLTHIEGGAGMEGTFSV